MNTLLADTARGPGAVARFLHPRSVAIVGMSARPGSVGQIILESLKLNAFEGPIHLVGRSTEPIAGRPVLRSPEELPEGVDLAVVALPAAAVREAIAACVKRKVGSALIFASGFAEMGDRGEQEDITRIARAGGLALVGPNCIGFTNNVDGIEVHLLYARAARRFRAGDAPGVAFIGQSGGLLGHLQRAAEARRVPLSYVVTTGNEAGLEVTDFLQYLLDDRATNVIAVYAEQIRRPREFLEACRRARAAGKPVVILHPGAGTRARAAAQSHTGSLAGDYATMLALVERAGALVVKTVDELTDTCAILTRFPQPPVKGPAILTASGAFVAVMNDFAEELGLDIPALEPATVRRVTELLPPFGIYGNPLDIGTAFARENVPAITRALLEDPNCGMLFVSAAAGIPAQRLNEGMAGATKPLAYVILGDGSELTPEIAKAIDETPAVFSRSTDRMLRAIAHYTRYGRALAQQRRPPATEPFERVPQLVRGPNPEWLGKRVLAAAGIRIPAGDLARTAEEAVAIAERVRYPVALKAQSAAIAHKTEAGGVQLRLSGAQAVHDAWRTIVRNVARAAPGVKLDGALVEKMAPAGVELMIGAKRDPDWGTVLLLGLGGIWVEALGDVQLLPDDVAEDEVLAALRRLRSAKLLDGFRGSPPADVDAVARAVLALARLMQTEPRILEIDINPLVVHARGEGATALDALIVTDA